MRRVAVVRTRGHKYGPILDETVLSVKTDVLLSGPNSCGKTRWLDKLHAHANEVWRAREVLYIRALEPLQRWYEDERFEKIALEQGKDWKKLRGFERVDVLLDWVKRTRPVLLLDDAHLLSGRKLDVALRMCREAGRVISSTFAEQRTPITLRMALDLRAPQKVYMGSEAAYDYTNVVMWIIILACMLMGAWQLAVAIGGAKILSRGKRASKQI